LGFWGYTSKRLLGYQCFDHVWLVFKLLLVLLNLEFAHLIPVNIIEIIVAVYLKLFEGLRLLKRLTRA
jgi:uncharacterized membrane protein